MKNKEKFYIRVLYKSGYYHDFWVYNFKYTSSGGELNSVEWEAIESENKPVLIGVHEIAAVWQIGHEPA